MVKFLLKKSYSRKDLKEKDFKDLWNAHGVFTTMWIYGKPQKILFFKDNSEIKDWFLISCFNRFSSLFNELILFVD